jgi:predicted RNA-binding Zn-ribbon protein involved in translation (DUF1610 family)
MIEITRQPYCTECGTELPQQYANLDACPFCGGKVMVRTSRVTSCHSVEEEPCWQNRATVPADWIEDGDWQDYVDEQRERRAAQRGLG